MGSTAAGKIKKPSAKIRRIKILHKRMLETALLGYQPHIISELKGLVNGHLLSDGCLVVDTNPADFITDRCKAENNYGKQETKKTLRQRRNRKYRLFRAGKLLNAGPIYEVKLTSREHTTVTLGYCPNIMRPRGAPGASGGGPSGGDGGDGGGRGAVGGGGDVIGVDDPGSGATQERERPKKKKKKKSH